MAESKLILVIDDEAPIRRMLEFKLSQAGYQVICAADGEEGLNLIRTQRPDVVITDVKMPKLDGRELCQFAQKMKREHPFLTVIITGSIWEETWDGLRDLPDTVLLQKPFRPYRLQECVDRYFETRHGGRA